MQSKKETTERDPKKDPKAMKKRDTHEREEAEREIDGKRPRLDQTIPYRGLVYATRVSDELGSGPDRSFLFFFLLPDFREKDVLKLNSNSLSCIKRRQRTLRKENKSQFSVNAGTARYSEINE